VLPVPSGFKQSYQPTVDIVDQVADLFELYQGLDTYFKSIWDSRVLVNAVTRLRFAASRGAVCCCALSV
jgi:hypothetical protein